MKTTRDIKKFIIALYNLGERQFAQETKARKMIIDYLSILGIPHVVETFTTFLPLIKKSVLFLDGRSVPCAGTTMVSGKINGVNHLISSLTSSQNFLFNENINFNPLCKAISKSNHYFAPSLAIPRQVVSAIIRSQKVSGRVVVSKTRHQSANILVGNKTNPRCLIFSHYDSIYGGAVDNASGTAVSLFLAANNPDLLKNNLFIFSGNEELSYDKPIYWGHGYRIFENKHKKLLEKAKKIFVVDCIGFSKTFFIGEEKIVRLGLPVFSLPKIISKTKLVIGDMEQMMTFYHSELDRPSLINESHLIRSVHMIHKALLDKDS